MSRHTKRERKTDTSVRRSRFAWLVVAAGTVIIIFAVILAGRGGQASPARDGEVAPRVAVAQEVFDYGDVAVDTPIETVFRISNVGQGTLRILGTPRVELVEGC